MQEVSSVNSTSAYSLRPLCLIKNSDLHLKSTATTVIVHHSAQVTERKKEREGEGRRAPFASEKDGN